MSDNQVLRIERDFSSNPEAVYDAWTDPKVLVQWWGPEGVTIPDFEMDVREDGRWITTMMGAEGNKNICSGVYKVLERPNRLVFTWAWVQDDGGRGHETQVELSFVEIDTGTRMTLVQSRFESEDACKNHSMGWNSSFNKLAKTVG